MEHKIVHDFQNLRMFTSLTSVDMDELVHDLTFALEETSNLSRTRSTDSLPALMTQALKRHHKKRRSTKRRSFPTGRDSEASESSIDEALKDYMESVSVQQSDSDDCTVSSSSRMPAFNIRQNVISLVESDSLTENFSPLRPLRRRRKFKRMAVDAGPSDEFAIPSARTLRPKRTKSKTKLDGDDKSMDASCGDGEGGTLTRKSAELVMGKRKRTHRQSGSGIENDQDDMMEEIASPSSSSLSSSDADHEDGTVTHDEGREADDEQSDFFHEAGPACGIPPILTCWAPPEPDLGQDQAMSDPELSKMFSGPLSTATAPASQRSFKARLSKILHSHGREIRYGRRRLNDKMPRYSMARYMQDRQKWKDSAARNYPPTTAAWPSGQSNTTETKRRRKTPPNSSAEAVTPEPEYPDEGMGSQMLQMIGWTVSNGHPSGSSGLKTPVLNRPKRYHQTHGVCDKA